MWRGLIVGVERHLLFGHSGHYYCALLLRAVRCTLRDQCCGISATTRRYVDPQKNDAVPPPPRYGYHHHYDYDYDYVYDDHSATTESRTVTLTRTDEF